MPQTNPEDQRPSDVEAPGRDRALNYGDGPDPATADAAPEDATLEREEDIEPEIAADDAGASAAAEMMGKARLREH